ncbi:MAG: hypothetical protein V9G13_01880 [Marmoricola sp.]
MPRHIDPARQSHHSSPNRRVKPPLPVGQCGSANRLLADPVWSRAIEFSSPESLRGAQARVDVTVTGATLSRYDLIPFTSGPCTAGWQQLRLYGGSRQFRSSTSPVIGLANGSLKATVTPIGYDRPQPWR